MKTLIQSIIALMLPPALASSAATVHVSPVAPNPVAPFATWETAAHNIQQALDAAMPGDTVLVTNGFYAGGERNSNRVEVAKAVRLQSVNGPLVTAIVGRGAESPLSLPTNALRCVALVSGAVLSGFTLTNGFYRGSDQSGGGVFGVTGNAIVTNCIITGNGSEVRGGGAARCELYNCTIQGNWAMLGGGAVDSKLFNCTIISNWASGGEFSFNGGAGAWRSTLVGCILIGNRGGGGVAAGRSSLYKCLLAGNSGRTDTLGTCAFYACTIVGNDGLLDGQAVGSIVYGNAPGNYLPRSTLRYCLTSPLPTSGIGNINADPGFVNPAQGNYRLRFDSPCLETGTNLVGQNLIGWDFNRLADVVALTLSDATDLGGRPRSVDQAGKPAWDIGAYEYDPGKLRFHSDFRLRGDGFSLKLQGEPGVSVRIERSRNLVIWETVVTSPVPAAGREFLDPAISGEPTFFYRAVAD